MQESLHLLIHHFREKFLLRWVLANILGWSFGLYAGAWLLSIVGGFGGLIFGGAVAGFIVGGAQWLALLGQFPSHKQRWLAISSLGGLFGAILVFMLGTVALFLAFIWISLGFGAGLFVLGAIFGAVFGGMQSLSLRVFFGERALWWVAANTLAGGFCGAWSLPASSFWLPIVCSPGPLIFGLITGYALHRMRQSAYNDSENE